jgi:hypothetical protein
VDVGSYPTTDQGLEALRTKPESKTGTARTCRRRFRWIPGGTRMSTAARVSTGTTRSSPTAPMAAKVGKVWMRTL